MITKEELLKEWNNGIIRGSQLKLARVMGLSHVSITRWFSGQQIPSEENIKKMAKIFKKSEEDINALFGKGQKHDIDLRSAFALEDSNTLTLPILAGVPAGLPEYSEDDIEHFTKIPRALFPGASFLVKCIGDSLEPEIKKGDYCVIKKMSEPIHGRPMLVKTESGFTMKIISIDGKKIKLCSLNHGYKPITPKQLEIIGLVIGDWSRKDNRNWLGDTRND